MISPNIWYNVYLVILNFYGDVCKLITILDYISLICMLKFYGNFNYTLFDLKTKASVIYMF